MPRLRSPLVVQLELTENCNHRCYYCYNFFGHHSNSFLNEGSLERISQQLISNQVFSVILTGGEPFLNRKGLNLAITQMRDSPIDLYVNTNLSNPLDSETLENLKRTNLVLVSFPSYDEATFNLTVGNDSQKKVLENIEKLVSENIPFGINQVVTKKNKNQVYSTGMFLYEKFKKLKVFSSTPVVAVRTEDKEYELVPEEIIAVGQELIRLQKDTGVKTDMLTCIPPCFFPKDMSDNLMAMHGCSAGVDMAVIGADGGVRRCTKLSQSYGNLLEENLDIIWQRMDAYEKPKNSSCEDCISPYGCYGGCEIRTNFNGSDFLIKGNKNFNPQPAKKLEDGKKYIIEKVKSRQEASDILISNGTFVRGNSKLLDFIRSIEGKPLDRAGIEKQFGIVGVNLISYLYNKGIVRNAV